MSLNPRVVSPPEHRPDRYAANWLLAATMLACALHITRLPPAMIAGSLILLGWRYMATNHGWRTPGMLLRLVMLGIAVATVFAHFGGVLGRDPGVALLVALVCLKLLEIRQLRDYLVTATLLFFVTLAAFLYGQSPLLAAAGITVAWVTAVTLVYLSLPDRIPLGEAVGLTGGLLLRALPLVLLMYLLFPRIQGGLWGLPGDAYSGMTGLDDIVAPGSVNELAADESVAFRVEFDGPTPEARHLYWRTLVLRDTDGRVWLRGDGGPRTESLDPGEPAGERWRYSITFEPSGRRWLPALDYPITLPDSALVRPGRILEHGRLLRERVRYAVDSAEALSRIEPLSSAERARTTRIPVGITPRVRSLAEQWREEANGDAATVVSLGLAHFNNEPFRYTLVPPALEGDQPIDEFLFDTQAGFCEHFASAFAVLLRLAGVPARLVVGYLGGEQALGGDYLIVRQYDAHAWVEAWLGDDQGWVRVDPTAAVAPERVELGLDAIRRLELQGLSAREMSVEELRNALQLGWTERGWRNARLSWDALNTLWYDTVLDYDRQRQNDFMRNFGVASPSPLVLAGILSATAALVLVMLAVSMLYRRPRQDPLTAAWIRFCKRLARAGVIRRADEGPRDFVQRAARTLPASAHDIEDVGGRFIHALYAETMDRQDAARLAERVRGLRLPHAGRGQR